jgi:FMN phosphatase YigB (HAD superfamily)
MWASSAGSPGLIGLVPFPTSDAGARVLFVGDSYERDIRPACSLGLRTAWIAPPGTKAREADVVIASLPELATVIT